VAGLRSDQLGELMLSPRPPSGTGGLLLRGEGTGGGLLPRGRKGGDLDGKGGEWNSSKVKVNRIKTGQFITSSRLGKGKNIAMSVSACLSVSQQVFTSLMPAMLLVAVAWSSSDKKQYVMYFRVYR